MIFLFWNELVTQIMTDVWTPWISDCFQFLCTEAKTSEIFSFSIFASLVKKNCQQSKGVAGFHCSAGRFIILDSICGKVFHDLLSKMFGRFHRPVMIFLTCSFWQNYSSRTEWPWRSPRCPEVAVKGPLKELGNTVGSHY